MMWAKAWNMPLGRLKTMPTVDKLTGRAAACRAPNRQEDGLAGTSWK